MKIVDCVFMEIFTFLRTAEFNSALPYTIGQELLSVSALIGKI
jgi:hypothetical protein